MSEDLTTKETTLLYRSAYNESVKDIDSLGLGTTPPRVKGFDGYLPSGISKASLPIILEEMEKMEAFVQYVQLLGIDAKNQLRTAEETLKNLKADVRKRKTGNKDFKDDSTITDPEYVLANAEYLRKLYSYEKISAREEMARRDIKFLSRLITAAEVDNSTSRMSNNVISTSKPKRKWK